jgi:hypothetical protein
VDARPTEPDAGKEAPLPNDLTVTEGVLRRLGRPRWLWISVWSLVALISPLVYGSAIRLSGQPLPLREVLELLTTQAVLAYVCFVLLAGGLHLAGKAREVRPTISSLVIEPGRAPSFAAIGSVAGPLLLTAIVAAVMIASGWARYGPIPPLASLPLLFIYLLPILTYVWIYLAILVDLDRLGRRPLALDRFPHDRTLGLKPVGALASTGLGLLLVASVPILVAGSDEPVTFAVSLAIVAVSVATFVLSMWRLHRQMTLARDRFLALASRLYADAYAPLRDDPTVRTLEARAGVLRVAQSLDERAESLLTWPVDEGTMRFLAVIVTSVLTSVIVRALFAAVGF